MLIYKCSKCDYTESLDTLRYKIIDIDYSNDLSSYNFMKEKGKRVYDFRRAFIYAIQSEEIERTDEYCVNEYHFTCPSCGHITSWYFDEPAGLDYYYHNIDILKLLTMPPIEFSEALIRERDNPERSMYRRDP